MKRVGIVAQHVASPQAYDIVIRNGTVFDGLRTPRFVSDIGICDGKIATIGRISKDVICKKEVDATGKNVCPGFVDLHTHYDAQIFWDPYCTLSGWHGVTSLVIGNCGFGYAPCKPENRVRYMKGLERNEAVPYEAQEKGMPWDWETFPEFLDSLDRTPKGVNILSYVGITPIMIHVMGVENARKRQATDEEMKEMQRILREAMEAGACGFSLQRGGRDSVQRDYDGEPMVTDTMSKEDMYKFGHVLNELGRGFIQVTGPRIKTTENIAKASGRPVIYNAVTPETDQHGQPKENHGKIMSWLRAANQEKGLRIYGQAITTMGDASSVTLLSLDNWNLFDASKPWREITLGTPEERMRRMQDPKYRQACIDQYENPSSKSSSANDGALGMSLKRLILDSTGKESLKKYEGKTLQEISEDRKQSIVNTFLDVSIEDDLKVMWKSIPKPTNLDELKKVANNEYTLPGVSDGGAHTKFITAGEYSTEFLASLVRDNDAMSLEDAHWKLSKYCAQAAGMFDRGALSVGAPADVLVYDYKALRLLDPEVAYDFPGGEWRRIRRAEGYDYTIVNGVITFEGNRCTGATPGKLLRHGLGE